LAINALLAVFHDGKVVEAIAAVSAIGHLGEHATPAVTPLSRCLKDPGSEITLRIAVAEALGNLGRVAAASVPVLRLCLRDSVDELRKAGVTALGNMGAASAPALPGITERIKDFNADVRRAASQALSTLGVHAALAIPALEVFAEDSLQEVRDAADLARRHILYKISLEEDEPSGWDSGNSSCAASVSEDEGCDEDCNGNSARPEISNGDRLELKSDICAYKHESGMVRATVGKFPSRIGGVPTVLDVLHVGCDRIQVRGMTRMKTHEAWVDIDDSLEHVLIKA